MPVRLGILGRSRACMCAQRRIHRSRSVNPAPSFLYTNARARTFLTICDTHLPILFTHLELATLLRPLVQVSTRHLIPPHNTHHQASYRPHMTSLSVSIAKLVNDCECPWEMHLCVLCFTFTHAYIYTYIRVYIE